MRIYSAQLGRPANIIDAWHKFTGAEYTALVTDTEIELCMVERPRRDTEIYKRYERGEIDERELWRLREELYREIDQRVAEARRSDEPTKRRTEYGWT